MAIIRTKYDVRISELLSLLAGKNELADRVRRLCVDKPEKLSRVVLKPVLAESTMESDIILEPSDFLEKLVLAVRTNNCDEIAILEHEAVTPSLVAQLG